MILIRHTLNYIRILRLYTTKIQNECGFSTVPDVLGYYRGQPSSTPEALKTYNALKLQTKAFVAEDQPSKLSFHRSHYPMQI